jgi:hypothetical protein
MVELNLPIMELHLPTTELITEWCTRFVKMISARESTGGRQMMHHSCSYPAKMPEFEVRFNRVLTCGSLCSGFIIITRVVITKNTMPQNKRNSVASKQHMVHYFDKYQNIQVQTQLRLMAVYLDLPMFVVSNPKAPIPTPSLWQQGLHWRCPEWSEMADAI